VSGVAEKQEVRPLGRRRVMKFGFILCLLLVIIAIGFNVVDMFGPPSYPATYFSYAPLYISTLVLCFAVIVGLLALMSEE
jgi:hypothetical protein